MVTDAFWRVGDHMLTAERLRELLDYDPQTGVFTWLVGRSGTARSGTVAGAARSPHGYRRIKVDGRLYLAHRLAFLYMTGEWPTDQVDHISGDGRDNAWANLRGATNLQNAANHRKRSDNTSGFKGVTFLKPQQLWMAQIKVRRKNIYLGCFADPAEAHAAYCAAAKKHFGEFARPA